MVMGQVRKWNAKSKKAVVTTIQPTKKAVVDNRQLTKKIKQVINKVDNNPLQNYITFLPPTSPTANTWYYCQLYTNSVVDTQKLIFSRIRWELKYTKLTDDTTSMRILMIKKRVPLTNIADNATVGTTSSTGILKTTNFNSLIDKQNDGDNVVLYDRTFRLRKSNDSAVSNQVTLLNFVKKHNVVLSTKNYEQVDLLFTFSQSLTIDPAGKIFVEYTTVKT